METNYKYAIVDKYNKVYWIRSDNKYELGMPSEDFTAYFRTIPLNPEDNLTSLFSKYMKGNQCYISFPGRNGRMEYMAGKYLLMSKCWTFDLFNHEMFVEQLAQIMKISIDSERVIKEVNFNLCNTEKEVLQGVQFPIILKPNFPENQ